MDVTINSPAGYCPSCGHALAGRDVCPTCPKLSFEDTLFIESPLPATAPLPTAGAAQPSGEAANGSADAAVRHRALDPAQREQWLHGTWTPE